MKTLNKNPNIRIGINPISWCNDDMPELGAETTLDTILSEGSEIGYQGFELGGRFPKDKQDLKNLFKQYNVACVSGWYSGELAHEKGNDISAEIERAHNHMELLAFNDCKVVVYGEVAGSIQGQIKTPLIHRPTFNKPEEWQAYGERLSKFGAHLKSKYGITLGFHHHMGSYTQSAQDIDTLMANTSEDVGLLFDSGHAYFGGADPIELLQRYIKRVVHVHCKDVRAEIITKARNEQWSFLQSVLNGVFTVPGDGAIDFAAIWSILKKANYQGWLVVEAEQDPALAPSYQYASKGFKTICDLIN